jgi:hypothetical protein
MEPGDWTVNAKLAQLDPQLAQYLTLLHFKPINPDAAAVSDVAKATVDNYVSSIVSLVQATKMMQSVAKVPGNFGEPAGGRGASASSNL